MLALASVRNCYQLMRRAQTARTRKAVDRGSSRLETVIPTKWLESRKAELLPVEYFHVVFDHERWIACMPGFFLPVRVLSKLFRRLFLEELEDAFYQRQLHFPGSIEPLQDAFAFAELLRSQENHEWVVYAKPPFGGPQQAIEYLGRYTHRVAISNQRLLSGQDGQVSFQWKDYKHENKQNSKIMTIDADEFIRRFLGQWRRYMADLSGD
jgi:hypothetical protein